MRHVVTIVCHAVSLVIETLDVMVTVPVLLSWRAFGVVPLASHIMGSSVLEVPDRYRCLVLAPPERAQQALLVLHRVRETLVGQRIQLINTIRGHMAEFGVVAAQGAANVQQLIIRLADPDDTCIPARARAVLLLQVDQLRDTERRIAELDDQIKEQAQQDEAVKRLMTIPGVGPVVATAITATLGDGRAFASGRHLAAWLGLVPGQRSTGGKERLVGITKAGDGYLRRLLVNGARALTRWWRSRSPWLMALLARRPVNVATVALANKMARVIWVVLVRGQVYRTAA